MGCKLGGGGARAHRSVFDFVASTRDCMCRKTDTNDYAHGTGGHDELVEGSGHKAHAKANYTQVENEK